MDDKYLLQPDSIEVFDQEKYEKNIKENGPFSDDAERGEDE